MKQYAMYLRKSRSDLEIEAFHKEDTLKRHRMMLEELSKQLQISVTDVFTEVVSGETIADRPEIQKLLQRIYQHQYAGVLVVEVERLARGDTKDQGTIAEAFKYTNTKIITPTKIYDPQNEFDEEYFEFGLFMSRREYKTIQRRMQRGKIASIQEGNYIASMRPYGYTIVRRSKKERTLEIVPEEAAVVQKIYAKFVQERWNVSQIARHLTKLGIPTYTGKQEWGHAAINEILHNPVYAGYVRWCYRPQIKTFDAHGTVQKKISPRGSDKMILVQGKHEAILSSELFEAAQNRFREEPNHVPLRTTLRNPFAGLVYCKICGRTFFYHDTKQTKGTRARMAHKSSPFCHVKSCFYDDFQATVLQSLQNTVTDFQTELKNNNEDPIFLEHQQMIAAAKTNQKELTIRRGQLFDFLERGIYSEADFLERKTLIEQQCTALEESLQELYSSAPRAIDYEEKIVSFSAAIHALENPDIDAKSKNNFLKTILARIEFSRESEENFILDIYLK